MGNAVRETIEKIKGGYLREMAREAKWMLGYVGKYRLKIIFTIFLGILSTVMGFVSSILMKYVIDAVTSKSAPALFLMGACYIAFLLGSLLVNYFSGLVSAKIRIRVDNEIRADIYRQILNTGWEEISAFHSGELLNRLGGDVTNVSNGVLDWVPNLISRIIQFAGALCIILYYDPMMMVFALLSAPVSILLSNYLMGRLRGFSKQTREMNGKLMAFQEESLQNVQTVKGFGLSSLYARRMEKNQKEYEEVNLSFSRFSQKNSFWLGLINQSVTILCFAWGVYRLWTGFITYGTMTMFLSLSSSLSASLSSLINLIPSAIHITTSAGRLMEISQLPREELPDLEAAEKLERENRGKGISLTAEDLEFSYLTGTPVFSHVSLEVHPGEIVALVGPSGQGKTTLLRLLLALAVPQAGRLFLTGENGDTLPLSPSTRTLFSYVPQGNTMFSGTVAENLRMVREEATDEELIQALKAACAYEFVERLPQGIHSAIGEKGGGFSEGQAQRLAIARALLRNAPLTLLDEATSALDVATERRVLRNLMETGPQKTCIVTTHRPSVLAICHRVYRISGGRVEQIHQDEISRMMADF